MPHGNKLKVATAGLYTAIAVLVLMVIDIEFFGGGASEAATVVIDLVFYGFSTPDWIGSAFNLTVFPAMWSGVVMLARYASLMR